MTRRCGCSCGTAWRRLACVGSRAGLREAVDTHVAGVFDDLFAAFLMVNDLAPLLLRGQIAAVLGADPLSPKGMARWAEVVIDVYRDGIFTMEEES